MENKYVGHKLSATKKISLHKQFMIIIIIIFFSFFLSNNIQYCIYLNVQCAGSLVIFCSVFVCFFLAVEKLYTR